MIHYRYFFCVAALADLRGPRHRRTSTHQIGPAPCRVTAQADHIGVQSPPHSHSGPRYILPYLVIPCTAVTCGSLSHLHHHSHHSFARLHVLVCTSSVGYQRAQIVYWKLERRTCKRLIFPPASQNTCQRAKRINVLYLAYLSPTPPAAHLIFPQNSDIPTEAPVLKRRRHPAGRAL